MNCCRRQCRVLFQILSEVCNNKYFLTCSQAQLELNFPAQLAKLDLNSAGNERSMLKSLIAQIGLIAWLDGAQNQRHKHLFESLPHVLNQSANLVRFWKIAFNERFLLQWDLVICLFIANVIDLAIVTKAVCITHSSKSSAKVSQKWKMLVIIKFRHSRYL